MSGTASTPDLLEIWVDVLIQQNVRYFIKRYLWENNCLSPKSRARNKLYGNGRFSQLGFNDLVS